MNEELYNLLMSKDYTDLTELEKELIIKHLESFCNMPIITYYTVKGNARKDLNIKLEEQYDI